MVRPQPVLEEKARQNVGKAKAGGDCGSSNAWLTVFHVSVQVLIGICLKLVYRQLNDLGKCYKAFRTFI